jgi:hypothetical protein
MSWTGASGNQAYADFQAKLLDGPPQYDPVEEHMRNVTRTAGRWLAFDVLVGGAVLWLWDQVPAAVAITIITIGALGLIRRISMARATGDPEPDPAVGA